jgi:serine protease Do
MRHGNAFSADGYAVTNYHVVDHANSVQVTTDDGGNLYTAKVIGTDPKTDLAVIKVDRKNDFPFVKFAGHTARVGDWVVAVGNPFGLGGTVTIQRHRGGIRQNLQTRLCSAVDLAGC